ncbi:MAG TPA: Crp/Fnr family transcriptional regulator [Chitinophagaceae bacterium]|nr:Crp/Fnr family transcriptional regulator [Chitinophagaceae bacterium]
MDKINLRQYLATNLHVVENDVLEIVEHCTVQQIKKDSFLVRQGEYCRHGFFVEQGLLRQYSIDEKGKEHIISFAPEGWFITDRESVYFNEPARYFIQAYENSQIVLLDEDFNQLISKKIPNYNTFNTKLLHNHIRHLLKRIDLLLSASAEDRYLQFVTMYPDILLRVPQTMVASYLGIAPESLSRVRKDLARKNFKK